MKIPRLFFPQCAQCRQCCSNTPTLVLNPVLLMNLERFLSPKEIGHAVVIYRISKNDLRRAADLWDHFPSEGPSLLEYLLGIVQQRKLGQRVGDFYEVAVLAKTSGKCPLLGRNGCIVGDFEPLQCALFPFKIHENKVSAYEICPHQKHFKAMNDIEREIKGVIEYYREIYARFAPEYRLKIRKLKEKFDPRIVDFKL